jgi:AcrR family transcriptional regulator
VSTNSRSPLRKRQLKPYAAGIERRRQIIECAHELFSVQGYRGASLRDIATKAGLTLPGLLHHFPSKQALLAAVLEHRDQVDIPWFEAKWEETGSFSDAVLELVSRSLCSPEVIQLFTTLSAEATDPAHPAHKYFQERYRRSRELFSDALRRAAERGEIRSGASGPLLIAILDGLQIQWLIEPDFDFLGELKAYLDDLAPPSKLQSKRRSGR